MTTTDELIARLANLETQAVQARQRQNSAEHALAAGQQRIQQLSSGDGATSTSAGVIDTRTLGKPKSFTGQKAEWTTRRFTFKAFACAPHPRNITEHERGQSNSYAPPVTGVLEQRPAKRVRFESLEPTSEVGRERLSVERASETDAEVLEPENSERTSSSSGVVIPSDVPMGETMDVEDANASPGEIGRPVSSCQSNREFEFGEHKRRERTL